MYPLASHFLFMLNFTFQPWVHGGFRAATKEATRAVLAMLGWRVFWPFRPWVLGSEYGGDEVILGSV